MKSYADVKILTERVVRLILESETASDEILLTKMFEAIKHKGYSEFVIKIRLEDGKEIIATWESIKKESTNE